MAADRPRAVDAGGQASVELLGALPALLLLGLVLLQLLAVGYSAVLAGAAAEAGALARVAGGDAREAAREAVPGWSRVRMRVRVSGGVVTVALRPPSPIARLARELEVTSTAAVGQAAGPAARSALPRSLARGARVERDADGRVRVRLRVPLVVRSWRGPVELQATARLADGG